MRPSVIYALLGSMGLAAIPAEAQQITCESPNDQRVECRIPANYQVRLVRTLGTKPCLLNRTFGWDATKIWVREGCRGVFEAKPAPPPPDPADRPSTYLLRCESIRNQTAECPVEPSGTVVLARTLSGAACTQGQSWERLGGSIYVNRGCRGEFEVTIQRRPARFDRPTNTSYEITCESRDGGRFSCRIGMGDTVQLAQVLSRKSCVEGSSWGVAGGYIWTDDGCRAEFRVTRSRQ